MKKTIRPDSFLLIAVFSLGLIVQGCASSITANPDDSNFETDVVPVPQEPTLLVCEIDSVSYDDEISNLAAVLAPLIRRDLSCVQQLSVIPTTSTESNKKAFFLKNDGLRRLAASHGANVIIVGLIREESGRIYVDLAAYDADSNFFLLRTEVKARRKDIYKLERRLVYSLIDALGIELTDQEKHRLTSSNPKEPSGADMYGRGLICEQKGLFTEALIALDKALKEDKELATPYAAEARIFRRMNSPIKAMESYEAAVAKDEFFAEAWYHLSLYVAQYINDDQKALSCCKKALEIAPRFGKARLSLGTRLHDLGRLSEAIEETKKAAESLPTDPLPRYNLGLYYLEAGDPAAARTWFELALAVDPEFGLANNQLQRPELRAVPKKAPSSARP